MNISQIEKELGYLKSRISKLEIEIEKEKEKQEQRGTMPIEPIQEKQPLEENEKNEQIIQDAVIDVPVEKPEQIKKESRISEAFVGKYALPVIASAMILIGICVMGFMVWSVIPDILKAGFVFLMAGCCFGIGCFFGKEPKMNVFKNAMMGTGMSILYADILLMHLAWSLIPELVTMILFVIWCASGILLSRYYKEKVFYWISVAGIAVTSLILKESMGRDLRSLVLCITILAAFMVNCMLFVRQYKEGSPSFGFAAVIIFYSLIHVIAKSFGQTNPFRTMQGLIIVAIFLFAYFKDDILYTDNEKTDPVSDIVSAALAISCPAFITQLEISGAGLFIEALMVIVFGVLFLKGERKRNIQSFFILPAFLWAFAYVSLYKMDNLVGWVLLAGILFVLAEKTDENYFSIQYMIVSVLYTIVSFAMLLFSFNDTISGILFMGFAAFLVNMAIIIYSSVKRKSYQDLMVGSGCLIANIYFLGCAAANNRNSAWIIVITIVVLFLAFAQTFYLSKVCFNGDKKTALKVLACIVSVMILNVYVCVHAVAAASVIAIVSIIHAALSLYIFGILDEGELWKDIWCSAYILVYMLTLSSKTVIWDYGIVLSLCVVILSSSFIVAGFAMKKKGMRLFGLITMMISIAKMILIDISETNSFIRVAALIIGGIVCFGISYTYNRLEKNLDEN